MEYFIGADLGTSALKLLLVNGNGEIYKTVSREYPVHYPHPGWSEQAPEGWWEAFVSGVRELTGGINAADIRGIGAGGQMHGLVILDDKDQVIRPAILWNDGRTEKQTQYLNTHIGQQTLSQQTANVAFAGFTAPKILWLQEEEPENFARISKIMLPKDYLNYRLTGVHATDFSDASGMLLLDVKNRKWSEQMLSVCGIQPEQMPRLFESYQVIGKVQPRMADLLGLSADTLVVAGAGDNAAAAVGTGTVKQGRCNISLGTSGTVFIPSDDFTVDESNALHAFCHADGHYHIMGCILSAAACNQWFCNQILGSNDYQALQQDITDDCLGRNDVFFLPYLMGERSPLNDTDARGTFTGLRMDTSRADMVQAVLEGVAFAVRDNVEIAKGQGIDITGSTLCGGGAASDLWQKILCNVLNIPLEIPQTEQGPGYGGALLAMVGTGTFTTVRECGEYFRKIRKTIRPDSAIAARYEAQYQKFSKIYPAMRELFKNLRNEE